MTDLERFKGFYSKVGIDLQPVKGPAPNGNIIFRIGAEDYNDNDTNHSEKFDGYFCFYSDIEFTPEGNFVRQGFWE